MIAALWLAAWVAPAQAQDDGGGLGCSIVTVFPSAQKDLLFDAATDNTNLYGAVGTAERKLLPAMHAHEGVGIMVFEQHVLAGALHVPAEGGGDCPYSTIRSPVDLTASNWALAWSGEDVGVFYNASVTGAYAAGSGPTRAMTGTVATVASIYYGLAAPFFPTGSTESDDGIITWDWIAGGEATPGTFAIRAGYVGSQGGYFQAAESKTGAFFGVASNQTFAKLPYLRGGVERLVVPKWAEKAGRSSLFGRKLVLPGAVGASADEPDNNFLTGHVAQEGIYKVVDVWATYAVKPTLFFHELRVGGHTPNYLGIDDRDEGWGARGTAGFVTMPTRIDLDVEGGRRFSGTLEVNYQLPGLSDYSLIEFSLRYNDPEVLAVFPYAEDALDIYFSLQFGSQ